MFFSFWKPDYFYVGKSHLTNASWHIPFNRGVSIGFGLFVLTIRWNKGRKLEREGYYIPSEPKPSR